MLSHFSCVWLFVILWTVACQVPLSMGFSRQEYWSGLPFPSLADLPDPGIEPTSLMSSALAGGFFITSAILNIQVISICLEKEMANYSSILAWRISWIQEPAGLHSIGLQRVEHNWSGLASKQYLFPLNIKNNHSGKQRGPWFSRTEMRCKRKEKTQGIPWRQDQQDFDAAGFEEGNEIRESCLSSSPHSSLEI